MYGSNGNILARSGNSSEPYGTAWLLTDRLGSVRNVFSLTGALQDAISYDAFGNMTQTNSTWTSNIGFTGFYVSAVTGIDFAQNREYLPSLGQWMSRTRQGWRRDRTRASTRGMMGRITSTQVGWRRTGLITRCHPRIAEQSPLKGKDDILGYYRQVLKIHGVVSAPSACRYAATHEG